MIRIPEPQQQARILARLLQEQGFSLKHQGALDMVAQLHGHRNWQVFQAAPKTEVVLAEATPDEMEVAGFTVGDLFSVRPDLSDEDADEVMHFISKHYDASLGLNWDRMEEYSFQWRNSVYAVDGVICSADWTSPVVVRLNSGTLMAGTISELNERRLKGDSGPVAALPALPKDAVLRIPNMPEIAMDGERVLGGGDTLFLQELVSEMRAVRSPLMLIAR